MRLSGLQREVLKLYRKCLREARKKPEVKITMPSPLTPTTDDRNRTLGATSNLMQGRSTTPMSTRLSDPYHRREFQRNRQVDKKDFATIEFLLRTGNRKLKMYSAPDITNIH